MLGQMLGQKSDPESDQGSDQILSQAPDWLPEPPAEKYQISQPQISVGDYVIVPFKSYQLVAVVWEVSPSSSYSGKLKSIIARLPLPPLSQPLRQLIEWTALYTLSNMGVVLKMAISEILKLSSKQLNDLRTFGTQKFCPPSPPLHSNYTNDYLTPEQHKIISEILNTIYNSPDSSMETRQSKFAPILLEGVTGSGKTEVYFAMIADCIRRGRQALIMLPEIALNPQIGARFAERFGFEALVWHSALSAKVRRENWFALSTSNPNLETNTTKSSVIIGARSALFLPYANLGLIIVDEEHDPSYKQEEGVIYQARDAAVMRAKMENIPIILASATPSLESRHNAQQKRYSYWCLPQRYGHATLPQVTVVNHYQQISVSNAANKEEAPKKDRPWLSPELTKAISQALNNNEQALLFLNRRGYSPVLLCHACGKHLSCHQCSCWLVWHKNTNIMICHHCSTQRPFSEHCNACGQHGSLNPYGLGIERVAELAQQTFPQAKIELLSSDLFSNSQQLEASLRRINDRQVNLLIGTQIIAKGHNFPYLTCVGILDADMGMIGGDFRLTERNVQLITQVAGRAGRAERPGHVYIQTTDPTSPVMQALKKYEFSTLQQIDLEARAKWQWPPFAKLAAVVISSPEPKLSQSWAQKFCYNLQQHTNVIQLLGPTPAPMFLLRGKYRWRLLVKSSKNYNLQTLLQQKVLDIKLPSNVKIQIDIDPYNFM